MRVRLADIAAARSGDKGNHANIGVVPLNHTSYLFLQRALSAQIVAQHFQSLKPTSVLRYDLPHLESLNFVLENVLEGSGSLSLRLDSQGKALAKALLELNLEMTDEDLVQCLPLPGDTQ